ncbi:MAG: hypothetical protein ABSC03_14940 [Verrucomicrobiota bacterium]
MTWKHWMVLWLCGWMPGGFSPLAAADRDADLLTAPPSSAELRAKWKGMTREEREMARQRWEAQRRVEADKFNHATPAQRRAMLKQRQEDLYRKRAGGAPLTGKEKKQLKRLEKRAKQNGRASPRPTHGTHEAPAVRSEN